MNYPDTEHAGYRDFVLCTTSASALDHDKGRALDPRKMLTHFSTSKSMQGIQPQKNETMKKGAVRRFYRREERVGLPSLKKSDRFRIACRFSEADLFSFTY